MITIATPERVSEAADALHEHGASPTVAAVRKEIGGGSASTIAPLLAKWREARARADALPPVPAPPQAYRSLWEATYRQVDAQWDVERKTRDEALESLRAELAERDAIITEIAGEVRDEKERREAAEARAAEAEARVDEAEAGRAAHAARLERAEERLRDAEEARRERDMQFRQVLAEEIQAVLEATAAASRAPAAGPSEDEGGPEVH